MSGSCVKGSNSKPVENSIAQTLRYLTSRMGCSMSPLTALRGKVAVAEQDSKGIRLIDDFNS
jgi:hypothetical protein